MRLMKQMAALVLSAAALSAQAYAADTAPAAQVSSVAKPARPAAVKGKLVSVPEPVNYKLILLGIGVLLLFARKSRKREQPWTK